MVRESGGNVTPREVEGRVRERFGGVGGELERLEVEYVPIGAVKPNFYNPNRQDPETMELLRRSIREDGFTQPIVVQRSTGEIVDGEHRWRAARAEGMVEVPVVYVDMTAEQMRVATLRHNRARGSEDVDLTAEVFRDLRDLGALDWAQGALGIGDAEMAEILDDVPAPERLADEDFSGAWIPERGQSVGDEGDGEVGISERRGTHGVEAVASTVGAVESARERRRVLEEAGGERDRAILSRGLEVPYRIQFVFTGEEAELVRGFLGERPAERLLEVCLERDERGRGGEADVEP